MSNETKAAKQKWKQGKTKAKLRDLTDAQIKEIQSTFSGVSNDDCSIMVDDGGTPITDPAATTSGSVVVMMAVAVQTQAQTDSI